ncbi:putative alanine racemase-domain-containing protein [Mycena belliarum]|uniref:Alanine racemase-domain-containing protein n=1 Tax=Mycena belliarum TaxID=1033014 RepID=A0AAD6TS41_9AGAR|nr:putative alanine racemase-domain-containing protein [Mycena belliae]
MVSSVLVDALSDPTRSLVELYNEIKDIDNFPARVAAHFADIFASKDAYSEARLHLHTVDPTQNDRCLVSFRAMIQDTSPSPEMYLAKRSGGRCGGWGLTDDQSTDDLEYSDLRENTVVWAVSVPSESPWVAAELDTASSLTRPTILESRPHKPHKFPDPGTPHLGVQVKVYDRVDSLRATDVATLVGILTMECMTADLESPNVAPVPTVHLLFSRHLPLTISPRVFPYSPATTTFQTLREELISWIADEGLAGDRDAAEWVLLSIIAKVQSRTPALLPPSLTISQFPPPAAQSSTPSLSTVLSHLLPTVVTLPLSLDVLNSSSFYPESKNEDLHSGRLQLPRGSVCVVTEGGVTEGGVFDRGIMNLRAMQEMMSTQTLEYAFPFSRFTFQTDVVFLILSQGKKSTFFQTNLNLPLRPNNKGELYSSPSKTKLPAPETLMMFRNLVGGAKTGNVSVGEKVAEYIQEDFVSERKAASSAATVTSDDLIHRMMIARLLTLSLHQSEVSTEIWERVKAMEETRKMRLDAIGSAK